ncbi:MAG: DPP IV N-terminal domain-containing protein [Carbonactinosporaceae bacterium]
MTSLGITATSLPRQHARTRRFSLGAPRDFTVAPDGGRVAFLRSRAGDDPLTCLWMLDVGGGERLVADPSALLGAAMEERSPEERRRRERAREHAAGIVGYATDAAVRRATFALSGPLWSADLDERGAGARELAAAPPVADPRPDPAGASVAYVSGGALHVIGMDGANDRALAVPEGRDVTCGLPEHVTAESMHRMRGYWWAPEGSRLLVARGTPRGCGGGTSPTPANRRRTSDRDRLSGRRHRQRRRLAVDRRPRRVAGAGGVGPRGVQSTWPPPAGTPAPCWWSYRVATSG